MQAANNTIGAVPPSEGGDVVSRRGKSGRLWGDTHQYESSITHSNVKRSNRDVGDGNNRNNKCCCAHFVRRFLFLVCESPSRSIEQNSTARDSGRKEKGFLCDQSGICCERGVGVERRCLFASYVTPSAVISVQSTLQ